MKFIKKMNEKEKFINYKSARNAFFFDTFALFIWSIFGQSANQGQISWQTTIMTLGVAIYVLSDVYYNEKMNDEQNKKNNS